MFSKSEINEMAAAYQVLIMCGFDPADAWALSYEVIYYGL